MDNKYYCHMCDKYININDNYHKKSVQHNYEVFTKTRDKEAYKEAISNLEKKGRTPIGKYTEADEIAYRDAIREYKLSKQ